MYATSALQVRRATFPDISRAEANLSERITRAGPSLPETLRLLAPHASALKILILSGNELGGTITTDIAAFTKLTELRLDKMGLKGASLGIPKHTARVKEIEERISQAMCQRRPSRCSAR